MFNLGGEGQFLMGSIVCRYIATQSGIEGLPAILLCLVGGAVAGGLWSLISGLLKVYRGQNEMIITIMLNYVATLFMGVVYTDWLRDGGVPQTQGRAGGPPAQPPLRPAGHLRLRHRPGGGTAGVLFPVLHLQGLPAAGRGPEHDGGGVQRLRGEEVHPDELYRLRRHRRPGRRQPLGTQFRLINGFGNGYGFDGVAMALIGQLASSGDHCGGHLLRLTLRVGSTTMQAATGVPTSVSDIIQALVIVFTVAGLAMVKLPGFKAFLGRLTERRKEAA